MGPVTSSGQQRLAERLDGKRILLTGVTGFVGEALLHRILGSLPGTHVTLLVRPKDSASGTDRIRAVLDKPMFAEIVATAGGVDHVVDDRVRVIEGDLADVPALPDDLDAVIHCAGDVSFDPPVDEAFRTNVEGVRQILHRVAEVGPHVH